MTWMLCMVAFFAWSLTGTAQPLRPNSPIKPKAVDLNSITYNWQDADGVTHTSNLTDKATDPRQILALLNEVYVNPDIPGYINHYEYKPDLTQWPVENQLSETYVDYEAHSRTFYTWNSSTRTRTNLGPRVSWIKCDGTVPQPNQEGATVLFVSIKDTWNADDIQEYYSGRYRSLPNAQKDLKFVEEAYESVQVIPHTLRVEDANNPGYLCMIDKVSTARFYYIAKGRVRSSNSSPLYMTYEQLSPVAQVPTDDMYEKLNSGSIYTFEHDCHDVFRGDQSAVYGKYIPHYAQISGIDDIEASTLTNLTLYLPDKRFKMPDNVSARPNGMLYNNQKPSPDNAVKMLSYKAFLEAEATKSATDGYYDIKLDWYSWLSADRLGATVPEEYYVYAVNSDGTKTLLDTFIGADANYEADSPLGATTTEKTYTFRVMQQEFRQTFNFIITASPIGSTIFSESNISKVIIPGHDQFFLVGADYRSRYDLSTEVNIYKNDLLVRPNENYDGINTTADYYHVYRLATDDDPVEIATISFTKNGATYDYNISYISASQNTTQTFDSEEPTLSGNIDESGMLRLIDRFTASTADNHHPKQYTYYISHSTQLSSNVYNVPVPKTSNTLETAGFLKDQVDADENRSLAEEHELKITFEAKIDAQQTIERYDVHRVNGTNFHTHIGKASRTDGTNLTVHGLHHETGNLAKELGTYDASTTVPISVYDDLEYCLDLDPRYVPIITTSVNNHLGDEVKNTYGCNILDIEIPELELSALPFERSKESYNSGTEMRFTSEITLTPTIPSILDGIYLYRVWRIDDDGNEVLLNSTTAPNEYSTIDDIKGYNPSTSPITFYDSFNGKALNADNEKTSVHYVVRMYSYRLGDSMPASVGIHPLAEEPVHDASHRYYITEKNITVNFTEDVVTGIDNVVFENVSKVMYYDTLGRASMQPWKGVNIVVCYKNDGSKTIVKRIF